MEARVELLEKTVAKQRDQIRTVTNLLVDVTRQLRALHGAQAALVEAIARLQVMDLDRDTIDGDLRELLENGGGS